MSTLRQDAEYDDLDTLQSLMGHEVEVFTHEGHVVWGTLVATPVGAIHVDQGVSAYGGTRMPTEIPLTDLAFIDRRNP